MDYPGFRFYPTEEELVSFYLQCKLFDESRTDFDRVIPVLNIYGFSPWDLPRYAGELCQEDDEQWFFFITRPDREARGRRPNRLTSLGHWKATGSPGYVYSSNDNRVIGVKRSMIFYTGRAPNGTKTDWKMNEYKAVADTTNQPPTFSSSSTSSTTTLQLREEMSLCRVYKSSKTLRSFDRRPCGVETIGEGGTSVEAITTSTVSADQNQNQNMMTTTMSLSSSGGHSNHNNEAGPSNYVNTDYMQVWEWEHMFSC